MSNLGVLGTGMVGEAIASRLAAVGHAVMMGSHDASNPKAVAWAARAGERARTGTFADCAAFGDIVFNCTSGAVSLDVVKAAGQSALAGKILVDVANRLPPDPRSAESLGEQLQRALPDTRVVKALNTLNCDLMLTPTALPGSHSIFLSGNDAGAKQEIKSLLATFGWLDIIDLGDIGTARAAVLAGAVPGPRYAPLQLRHCALTRTGSLARGRRAAPPSSQQRGCHALRRRQFASLAIYDSRRRIRASILEDRISRRALASGIIADDIAPASIGVAGENGARSRAREVQDGKT